MRQPQPWGRGLQVPSVRGHTSKNRGMSSLRVRTASPAGAQRVSRALPSRRAQAHAASAGLTELHVPVQLAPGSLQLIELGRGRLLQQHCVPCPTQRQPGWAKQTRHQGGSLPGLPWLGSQQGVQALQPGLAGRLARSGALCGLVRAPGSCSRPLGLLAASHPLGVGSLQQPLSAGLAQLMGREPG